MDTKTMIELFGYLGSLLVVVSMLMTSVMKLRVINTIGSSIFACYAFIIHSYPTAFMNIALIIINIINMKKLMSNTDSYEFVKVNPEDIYLKNFVSRYLEDIKRYFPNFSGIDENSDNTVYLAMNKDTAVGVIAGAVDNAETYDISVDYTTPSYRDCSVGTAFFEMLKKTEIKKAVFLKKCNEKEHVSYLRKMGFVKENDIFIKEIR